MTPNRGLFFGKCLVFKIQHHSQKGVLSYVRVYSGSIKASDSVYNVNRGKSEKIGKLMIAFADEFREVGAVSAGDIAVVSGLKLSTTGDTLVPSAAEARAAEGLAKGGEAKNEALNQDEDFEEEGVEVESAVLAGP